MVTEPNLTPRLVRGCREPRQTWVHEPSGWLSGMLWAAGAGSLSCWEETPLWPRASQQWEEVSTELHGSASVLKFNHITDLWGPGVTWRGIFRDCWEAKCLQA